MIFNPNRPTARKTTVLVDYNGVVIATQIKGDSTQNAAVLYGDRIVASNNVEIYAGQICPAVVQVVAVAANLLRGTLNDLMLRRRHRSHRILGWRLPSLSWICLAIDDMEKTSSRCAEQTSRQRKHANGLANNLKSAGLRHRSQETQRMSCSRHRKRCRSRAAP